VQITAMSAERYHDGERDYREPEKYEFCAFSAPMKDSNLLSSVIGQSQLC
jgi:hypothetical protein